MRRIFFALVVLLPSCMSTNLAAWADTRLASPAEENMRNAVAVLFILPALVGDGVLLPVQLIGGLYPYGNSMTPDPPHVRHGEAAPRVNLHPADSRYHTGPRGRVDRAAAR